ncbi:MAG TPA: hypothetical protein VFE46_04440 [Pirellulales bacterium]|nr:hypothetical protein [Pirellulales bacterium]
MFERSDAYFSSKLAQYNEFFEIGGIPMKRCGDKSSTKTEIEITTPGGKTTITAKKDVKPTGENPPSAHP